MQQGTQSSLSRRAINFLERGAYMDVEFIVGPEEGETESFLAHKLILAMSSEAFEAMFYGGLAEQRQVRVVDLDAVGFRYFIRYLYNERVEVTTILEALQARQAAQKYLVHDLVDLCTEFISKSIKSLPPEEACRAKDHLALFNEHAFDDDIAAIITTRSKEVLESEAFVEASEDTVHEILTMNILSVSEDDLLDALYAWARAESSKTTNNPSGEELRKVLDPFLSEVRFLAMTPKRFVEGPLAWSIFSADEALSILANLTEAGTAKLPEFCCRDRTPRVSDE